MDYPNVYDSHGEQRDWDWLLATFGEVTLQRAPLAPGVSHVFRLIAVRDVLGPATQIANVVDANGEPLEGVLVVRHWPDAPDLPTWEPPSSRWYEEGVYGPTNANGDIGFGLGGGDYYFPPKGGASSMWIADERGPSDCMSGLGMLGGSRHRRLDIAFQLMPVDTPPSPSPDPVPEPPPGPPDPLPEPPLPEPEPPVPQDGDKWALLFAKLDQVIRLLERSLE